MMTSSLAGMMRPLVGKLTRVMSDKYVKIKGARRQLEFLAKELISINATLEKHAAADRPDVQTKAWMKEVRELAYDIEDCVGLFTSLADGEPAATTAGVRSLIRRLKKLRRHHKLASRIHDLKAAASEVHERHKRYRLAGAGDGASSTAAVHHVEVDPRLPALYVETDKLVGVQGPKEEIVRRFIEEEGAPERRLRVVSIVGAGGLGKTTLANEVYKETKGRFDCTAFISVSQQPDIGGLLGHILQAVTHGSSERRSSNVQGLIDLLREYLQNKRYLIVIDDVWSTFAWEIIQCALPRNNCASKVITTTRILSVAKFCCTASDDFVYRMEPLSLSDSRSLFLKRMFGAENNCPAHLEGTMDQILRKCDGLPLAINSIASLLAGKPRRKEEWDRVRNSIGSTKDNGRELEVMEKILFMSYHDLPHNLKACFLYLSIFPEDYNIDKDNLVWKWIGEGFIDAKHGYRLDEVGESYFNELINRSLIQPAHMECGGIVSARVHDIVHDFILCRSVEENFVIIMDGQDLTSSHDKIRRLSFSKERYFIERSLSSYEVEKVLTKGTITLSHLRSLHLFGASFNWMQPSLDLKVLRVLDLGENPDSENSDLGNIGSLCQLRYLNLGVADRIDKLPAQIGMLRFLLTLDIRGTYIEELPESIAQLKQLVRLLGSSYIRKLPGGFGGMDALQELAGLCLRERDMDSFQELQKLSKLRMLHIKVKSDCLSNNDEQCYHNYLVPCLRKLGQCALRSLRICVVRFSLNMDDIRMDSWYPPPRLLEKFAIEHTCYFLRLPTWINSSLSNLTCLDIRVVQVEEEGVSRLKDLPALVVLRLSMEKTLLTKALTISYGGFQCLAEFYFTDDHGPGVMFEHGAMPNLQMLELGIDVHKALDGCGGSGFGIRHLSSLKYLKVSYSSYPPQEDLELAINNEVMLLRDRPKVKIKHGPQPDWGWLIQEQEEGWLIEEQQNGWLIEEEQSGWRWPREE